MAKCYLCPRECGAEREEGKLGFCKESDDIRIARYSLHSWEEPPISGTRGSGTIFFSGCTLRCEFCQNRIISHEGKGDIVTVERLAEIMLELENMGAHNVNLVTPTHFADKIARALTLVKDKLTIPVVYNTSGYEKVETLKLLDGLVDIYLPDFKYFSDELAQKYSHAKNYREITEKALVEMYRQVGEPIFDEAGLLKKGLVIRHLVLPTCRKDSMALLDKICEILPRDKVLISLMSQYTPDFAIAANTQYRELCRKITSFEYTSVTDYAASIGLDGFCQERTSASAKYTPDF